MQDSKEKVIDFFPDTIREFFSYLEQNPTELLTIPHLRGMLARQRYMARKNAHLKKMEDDRNKWIRTGTVNHNSANLDAMAEYDRGAELIEAVRAISYVADRAEELKVLSIGPRTETEILGLVGYGFSPPNIDAIDLISYSPYVHVGDMHEKPFDDNTYDIVIAGWVLASVMMRFALPER